ncbi:ribosomal protein L11 methylase PrmA [Pedobacter cryoconitis]|uniref:hypothetical protein n=1 Tax=Pedobacter cryoconitis TaxID=188932 RepID=UPI00161B34C2|nr:hypothetical protein [Pedobacter cryoconitis]MBB6269756.1 ribosomal protein L11 methylase PrmA [Pedobacter cryoconitis]
MSLQQAISYKDPAGFVVKLNDGYYRYIAHSYASEFDQLNNSGLYNLLIEERLMVSHREIELNREFPDFYKKIFPQQIGLISYPYEWSFLQWQQMLLCYIRINEIALDHGMILKDASPYNFTFHHGNCVLIDTLSFSFYKDGDPWVAYRQFCEESLSPFLLMYYKDPLWSKLYRGSITGLSLPFVSAHLPFKTNFDLFCLMHIHLHSRFKNRNKGSDDKHNGFTAEKLKVLFSSIKKNINQKKEPMLKNSIWEDYYEKDIESESYITDKTEVITKWLTAAKPEITIDLGANTGKFSSIASSLSKVVYAVESDIYCVNDIYQANRKTENNNVTTIVADLVDPSPGLGWSNDEKSPLLQRLKGDMVMALALIHHLCLSRNLPISFIARLFSNMTSRFAIVEFVPKEDPKSKILLQHKGDIFEHYTENDFILSFEQHFRLKASHSFENSLRKLYLWEKI